MKKFNLLVLLFVCTAMIAYSQSVPKPTHFYDFSEDASDSGLGAVDGEIIGDQVSLDSGGIITKSDDKDDSCILFETQDDGGWGTAGYVAIPNLDAINSENFTMTAWIKLDSEVERNHGYIFWNGGDVWPMPVESRRVDVWINKGAGVHTTAANVDATMVTPDPLVLDGADVFDGEWHLVGVTLKENKTISVYYDGEFVSEVTDDAGIVANENGLWLGSRPADDAGEKDINMMGLMDRVRIWDVALSMEQMAELFTGEGPEGGSVELWPVEPSGINNKSAVDVQVYPNPVVDNLNVTSNLEIDQINVYRISGQKIKSIKAIANNKTIIDTRDMTSGSYFIEIITSSGLKNTKQFVK